MLPLSPLTGIVAIRRSPQVFMPLLVSAARRRVATGAAPITSAKLSSNAKETRDAPRAGTEGLHIKDMLPPLEAPQTKHITGDWVLFHPVYTPSELKAVEVGRACGRLCDVAVFF